MKINTAAPVLLFVLLTAALTALSPAAAVPDQPCAQVLCTGTYGPNGKGIRFIRNAQDFGILWKALSAPDSSPPDIDFDHQMVAAIFMGFRSSGGYGYSLKSARVGTDKVIELTIIRHSPGGKNQTQAITHPYIVIQIPASQDPPRITFEDQAR